MRVYRADVRPYLNVDANGNTLGNGTYAVKLADSGSNGGGTPLTLGATLVVIYRLQSPGTPLNSIVLYDGSLAPNNQAALMTLPMVGFYQASASPVAKITHIVGNGQPNKAETVLVNGTTLTSPYGNTIPAFPGVYNQNSFSSTGGGSWDNPTWLVNSFGNAVKADDATATTSVVPSSSNSGCVNWGAVVFSSTVQNSDGDGILDVWKKNKGYTDVNTTQWVALPGAKSGQKDLFVELDYVSNLNGQAGNYLHSHLPKKAAIDKAGDALKGRGINVHFDLGPGIYQGDQYVISYPIAAPPAGGGTVYPGAGGNAVSESALVCNDGTTLCAFPGSSTVGWKGDLEFVQDQTTLGNFQFGRKDSYHYVLFGHALGSPRTYWSTAGGSGLATLNFISVQNNVGTVNLTTPPGLTRPGDADCTEASCGRVVIEGALQTANVKLNGVFLIQGPSSIPAGNSSTSTTTFTIQTSGVPNGTYSFANEPQLGLSYGGPSSDSGFSDIGGGDSTVTFGLWAADDPAGCQPDPSQTLNANQAYCVNQVGTVTAQAGTLIHEIGHTFFLTHGGAYYPNGVVTSGTQAGQQGNNPPAPASFGLNCNPAYISSMNYLFQIRGFPDGAGIDYSGQTLPNLAEGSLSETTGLGLDIYKGNAAAHFTRWYAPPNALDTQLQSTTGGHYASFHCDGSPITDGAQMVRVDGTLFPGATASAKIDWNHNLVFDSASPQDLNFDGTTSLAGMPGYNDVVNVDLRQIGARADAFGFSGGGTRVGGGGTRVGGGGTRVGGGGSRVGGGGTRVGGGGTEQDTDTANSTADAPTLNQPQMSGHNVLLTWVAPEFGQIRSYSIWRAEGSFTTIASVYANRAAFTNLTTPALTGAPPQTSYLDTTVQNKKTYTYFIVDTNKQGAQSPISAPVFITVRF